MAGQLIFDRHTVAMMGKNAFALSGELPISLPGDGTGPDGDSLDP